MTEPAWVPHAIKYRGTVGVVWAGRLLEHRGDRQVLIEVHAFRVNKEGTALATALCGAEPHPSDLQGSLRRNRNCRACRRKYDSIKEQS